MTDRSARAAGGPAKPVPAGLIERLSELRMIVAILFGIYGIVCIVWGVAFTTADELRRAAGIDVNLVAGVGMLVFAALFAAWALLKPLEEARSTTEQDDRSPDGR